MSDGPAHCKEIEIFEIFLIAWGFRKQILVVTLMATVVAIAVAYFMPKAYRSEALVEIGQQPVISDTGYLEFSKHSLEAPVGLRDKVRAGVYTDKVETTREESSQLFATVSANTIRGTNLLRLTAEGPIPTQLPIMLKATIGNMHKGLEQTFSEMIMPFNVQREKLEILYRATREKHELVLAEQVAESERAKKLAVIINSKKSGEIEKALYRRQLQESQMALAALKKQSIEYQSTLDTVWVDLKAPDSLLEGYEPLRIVRDSQVPTVPYRPQKSLIVLAGAATGFVLTLMVVFLIHSYRHYRFGKSAMKSLSA